MITSCLMALAFAIMLVGAADAKAAYYKMVACAGNNGAPPYSVGTNTTSPQNPGGIFEFHVWCNGQGGDPPGEHALMRIAENQPAGNAGHGAYGHFVFDTPSHVHFKTAGGYTRQFNAFNDGWRARFWVASASSTAQIMTQGAGLPNSGGQWASTGTFGPHLWPIGQLWDFTRFVYEMQCVRPAGCDRSNYNATDLNGLVFTLSDDSPAGVAFTDTGSALLAGSWVRGTQHSTFNVSDLGSGIRHERMRIDGAQVWGWDHWSECNTSSSGLNGEWARAYAPCPTGTHGRSIPINTAAYPDGARTLQICNQDYSQYQGLFGTAGETCSARTVRFDNTPPGAPSGLHVTSANPERYLDRFGAQFALPPNQGSPITKVHYEIVNAAGDIVKPKQVITAANPTAITGIEGPAKAGDYRLRIWLEDEVGLNGPAATASIPRDTTPPAAPQGVSVTAPNTSRAADGVDLRWHNIVDAGAPIDSARYQVLDGAGKVVIPAVIVGGNNVQAVADLDVPSAAGSYQLRLWLTDAEGNVGAPVIAPLAYDCMRSPTSGAQSLSATLGGQPAQTVAQGQGTALTGVLSNQGEAVATAPVCVYSRVETDAGREFLGIALTGPTGGYRFPVPSGPSREMIAIHRPDQRQLRATATLKTIVHPTLRTPRAVIRNKSAAYFEGEIPGPHNDQVTIVLQVKSGKGWLAFRRYRTRGDGHYELKYPFRRTNRPTTYEFRAQVRETVGYPYLQGDSDPLILRVLPARAKRPAAKHHCRKGARSVKRRGKVRCVKPKQRGRSQKAASSSRLSAK
ncbi:MAG: hypothetical protein JJE35_03735 [Thermoleophilia bacterium]|nr:hypothetical protein [Thermoleophilia bacterium]